MRITIPGQARSKKNNKRILGRGKKKFIGASALYMNWAKKALKWLSEQDYGEWEGDYPVEIKFFAIRESKRRFDWDNIIAGSLDIMQQAKIIKQDDMRHVTPIIQGWSIDKDNPRMEILIQPASKEYFRENI